MASPTHRTYVCPICGEAATERRFDLAVEDAADGERTFFGVPAGYCATCGRIVMSTEVLRLCRILPTADVTAIESDSALFQVGDRDPT